MIHYLILISVGFYVAAQDISFGWVANGGLEAIGFENEIHAECVAQWERLDCHPEANHPGM